MKEEQEEEEEEEGRSGGQWRSQAGAHWGTCPSNYRPCPTSAGICKRIIGTDSIVVNRKSGAKMSGKRTAQYRYVYPQDYESHVLTVREFGVYVTYTAL